MFTFEQIAELLELVAKRQLGGLEIEKSGFRLRIEGQKAAAVVAAPAIDAVALPVAPVARPAAPAPQGSPPVAAPVELSPPEGSHIINSPIVGTFYRASSPEAPSFVEVGSRVVPGQVLCIVEAMKLMNEIESDIAGVVSAIYPQNAQAVEYGEPLFAIVPG